MRHRSTVSLLVSVHCVDTSVGIFPVLRAEQQRSSFCHDDQNACLQTLFVCSPTLYNNQLTGPLPASLASLSNAWGYAAADCAIAQADTSYLAQHLAKGNKLAGPIPESFQHAFENANVEYPNLYVWLPRSVCCAHGSTIARCAR